MREHRKMEALSELELRNVFIESLSERMAKADRYYEYSDDHRVWLSSGIEISGIKEDLKLLSKLDGGLDEAKQLWAKHVPPHSVKVPDFFAEPKKIFAFMVGMFFREDIPVLTEKLEDQKNAGNRFVAFSSNPQIPPNDRFIGFSSSIEAMNFAEDYSVFYYSYKVHSISRMQREIQKVIEPAVEKHLRDIVNRLEEFSNHQKKSPGLDLSK